MDGDVVKSEIPLPDELLSDIISRFIPLCQWSSCLECISKQFQRCVLIAYGRMKSINCRKMYSLKKKQCYQYFQEGVDNIETCIQLSHILEKLFAVCPNLVDIRTRFNFVMSITHSNSISWDILAQFDCLQSISLTHIDNIAFRPFADFVAKSKNLKMLNITFCKFDSGGTLNVGSLSHVNFRYPIEVKPPEIYLEYLSEKLKSLTLYSLKKGFKNGRDAMKNCINLERFSVALITMDDYEIFLSMLSSLSKLTSICVNVHYRYPLELTAFNRHFCDHLSSLKNQLQCVQFNDITISEEVQHYLLSECLQLKSLILNRHCSPLSAGALKNLQTLPDNLKKMSLPIYCEQTLKILLQNLAKLTNFTDLTISGQYLDDWKEWENICCLVNLQNLQLGGPFVNDTLLQIWDDKNPEMFKKLVSFQVQYCPNISDKGAILLAKKARNLKILALCWSAISENTIFDLADFAKKLTEIDLMQGEPFLFDENAVISLIKKVTCLKKVKVCEQLVDKICRNENFLPLLENVEIETHRCL